MFWRAALTIAALYYVTVPPAERQATEAHLREAASQVPAQMLALCQERPQACAELGQKAGAVLAPNLPVAQALPQVTGSLVTGSLVTGSLGLPGAPPSAASTALPATAPSATAKPPTMTPVAGLPLPPRRPQAAAPRKGA